MKLTIVIPTYQRIRKLERCINSILKQTYQDFLIFIMADNNDEKTYRWVVDTYIDEPRIQAVPIEQHLYVMGCWNYFTRHLFKYIEDCMVWLVDDVELYPDCLEKAVKCFMDGFPDTDGIVGIGQVCPGHPAYTWKPYGQILIGRKFIERYKEVYYQVCCPDYLHFYQDEELWKYAKSLNKFKLCEQAKLKHYHPCFIKEEIDETHFIVRRDIIKKDRNIYNLRKSKGLIWGKSWETVNE